MAGRVKDLPAGVDAMRFCPSCGERRGSKTRGWAPVFIAGDLAGYTCPECPEWAEPIRRVQRADGPRFNATATAQGPNGRVQQKRVFRTLPEARAWLETARADLVARGGAERAERHTVSGLADEWLKAKALEVRKVTVDGYRVNLAAVLRHIGSMRVEDVDARTVEELVDWLMREGSRTGGPIKARSARAALKPLSMMFDRAVRDGLVSRNPVTLATLPRVGKRAAGKDLEHWTSDQLLRFRNAADEDDLAGAWRLTLSGLTRADVCGLRWSDVDLDAGTVTIRQGRVALSTGGDAVDEPKSEQRRRTVPVEAIHNGTADLLRAMWKRQAEQRLRAGKAWQASGYVLVDALGAPLRPEVYSDRFRRLCSVAGVPTIHLHSVRHSLAFWLHSLGVAPRDAAALLGHTLEVHLATYLPEGGGAGVLAAAEALGKAANAA